MNRCVLALWLFVLPLAAHSQSTCYEWRQNPAHPWHPSAAAASQYRVDLCNSGDPVLASCSSGASCGPPHTCTTTGYSLTVSTFPSYSVVFTVERTDGATSAVTTHNSTGQTVTGRVNPVGCPECPAAGAPKNFRSVMGDVGSSSCDRNGCEYRIEATGVLDLTTGTRSPSRGTSTGRACSASTGESDLPSVEDGDCDRVNGALVCLDTDTRCSSVDGDIVCPDEVPDEACVGFSSGGVACDSAADTPPAPDNGTPGTPATPVVQVVTNTSTVNYYSSTTVNGASSPPTTGPPRGGDAGGSDADGEGDGEGEGEGNGCPDDDCSGVGPVLDTEVCEFGECAQEFLSRVQGSPLLSSVSSAGSSVPTGSCPSINISMFGETMSLSQPMCDLWTDISSILSALMLIVYAWMGTRIVLSA